MDSEPKNLSDEQHVSAGSQAQGRRFWKDARIGDIDLVEVMRRSYPSGPVYFPTKRWLKALRRGIRLREQKRARQQAARQRERWRAKKLSEGIVHRRPCRPPHSLSIGATTLDRITILAMEPFGWQTPRQIAERADWTQGKPQYKDDWPARMCARADSIRSHALELRFVPHGLAERTGRPWKGRGKGGLFYQLTDAGRELRAQIERGVLPPRRPHVNSVLFPVGWTARHRKIVCALSLEAWRTEREIYEAAMPGCTKQAGHNLVGARGMVRLLPAGLVERRERQDGEWRTEDGLDGPRWVYRLTQRGAALREALMLID